MRFKGIIFDVDGTLGDTVRICYAGLRHAFAKTTGQNYTDSEIDAMFGPTEEGIMRKHAPDRWEAAVAIYLEEYEKLHRSRSVAFPDLDRALDLLKQKGVALAVVTGKGSSTAEISLRHLGMSDTFDVVETGSDDGPVKPQLIRRVLDRWGFAPAEVAYVGDSVQDVGSSEEAGVVAIAAAWAETSSAERLAARSPHAVFPTVESFIEWIERNGA